MDPSDSVQHINDCIHFIYCSMSLWGSLGFYYDITRMINSPIMSSFKIWINANFKWINEIRFLFSRVILMILNHILCSNGPTSIFCVRSWPCVRSAVSTPSCQQMRNITGRGEAIKQGIICELFTMAFLHMIKCYII